MKINIMKDTKLIILMFISGFFLNDTAAQEIWQVDSRIESMSLKDNGKSKTITIQVKADNDDTGRSPKLIVTLPRNSKVTSVTMDENFKTTPYQVMGHGNLALGHVNENIDSYVQFDLRNLTKETFEVRITIKPMSDGFQKSAEASAFIYGITPERNKENNYKVIQLNDDNTPNIYSFPAKWPKKLPLQVPISVPDICKYVIDCPGCGINALCLGDIFRIPGYLDLESVQLIIDKRVISEAVYNKKLKSFDLAIPQDIGRKQAPKYFLKFN